MGLLGCTTKAVSARKLETQSEGVHCQLSSGHAINCKIVGVLVKNKIKSMFCLSYFLLLHIRV